MIKEKSCGIVLINRAPGGLSGGKSGGTAYSGTTTNNASAEPKFLLLHYPQGHFDFPKGHIEPDENELETAQRELFEETGIADIKFIDGFREKISYCFKGNGKTICKDVYFFLAETQTTYVRLSDEHQGSGWFAYEEARKKITFDQSRKVLEKAQIFLYSHAKKTQS